MYKNTYYVLFFILHFITTKKNIIFIMPSTPFSIDAIIVYVFILITLIVGLRAGRGVKDIKDYAIGNRKFGTIGLLCTYLATIYGGHIIYQTGETYTDGLIFIIALFGFVISNITTALFIAPKAVRFPDCFTMGDIMKTLYGKYPGVITGILGSVSAIMITGMELTVLGIVAQHFFKIPALYSIIIGGMVFTIYSAHGGIKSVVTTDILQFIMLVIGIPLIAYMVVNKFGGIEHIFTTVPKEKIQIFGHKKFGKYLGLFLAFSIFPVSMLDPAVIQRMLMGRKASHLRKQHLVASVFGGFYLTIILTIGLGGYLLYNNSSINQSNILLNIISDLLPVGIKGLAMAGIFAMIMSTADSFLHSAGLSMVHDVLNPIARNKENFRKKEKKFTQIATIFAGIIAVIIGLNTTDLFGFFLSILETTVPILLIPLFSGMMGLKTDKKSFFVGMSCTIVVWINCKIFLPENYADFALPLMLIANGIAFFGTHIIRNKGIATVKQKSKGISLWKPSGKKLMNHIKNILPTPKNIYRYSVTRTEKYGGPYILFGIFFTFHFLLPNFIDLHGNDINKEFLVYLRIFAAILCVLLITKNEWNPNIKRFFPLFWHFTILYCLPFLSTLTLLVAHGKIEWLINIFGTVIFLIVLVDWLSAVFIGLLGTALACIVYANFIGPLGEALNFHAGYLLIYQTIFAMALGFVFARRKQIKHNQITDDNSALSNKNQEMLNDLVEIAQNRRTILSVLKESKLDDLSHLVIDLKTLQKKVEKKGNQVLAEQIKAIHKPLMQIALKIDAIEERANHLKLQIDSIDSNILIEDIKNQISAYKNIKNIVSNIDDKSKNSIIKCDLARIKAATINAIEILRKKYPDRNIHIALYDTVLTYPIKSVTKKYQKKVNAQMAVFYTQELPELQNAYPGQKINTLEEISLDEETKLLSEKNNQIISAHYGYIEQYSHACIYIIPKDIREVRDKENDNKIMLLGEPMHMSDDGYPGAKEKEEELMGLVQKYDTLDQEEIREVIQEIKKLHGHVRRRSGEPYYLHPIEVAIIAIQYDQSREAVIAALLHDTIEDTPITSNYIAVSYGSEISNIVKDVTHMYGKGFNKVMLSSKENIAQLLNSTDKRSLIIKLADRLHNMRTIQYKSVKSQIVKVDETLSFFVPLAQQLSLGEVAQELKAICMKILENDGIKP